MYQRFDGNKVIICDACGFSLPQALLYYGEIKCRCGKRAFNTENETVVKLPTKQ